MLWEFFSAWAGIRLSTVLSYSVCAIFIIIKTNAKNGYNNYDTKLKSLSDAEYFIVL